MADKFPEMPRTSHRPDGEAPAYVRTSQKVGVGHEDYEGRMPHPQGEEAPNKESGEGKGCA